MDKVDVAHCSTLHLVRFGLVKPGHDQYILNHACASSPEVSGILDLGNVFVQPIHRPMRTKISCTKTQTIPNAPDISDHRILRPG